MSVKGLELLRDLTEIVNTGQALDNLCNSNAEPFTSDDFRVFRGNKNNTSTLSYIPNNFTFSLSSFEPLANKISVQSSIDIDQEIINLNIGIGDKINGPGIVEDSIIERIDIYLDELNVYNLPVTEIILDTLINTEQFTGEVSITKQNSATIQNDFFILGADIQANFYDGDKITNITYLLSGDALPLLGTNTRSLYIVDLSLDIQERLTFGLAVSAGGERIDLTSLHPLSVINIYRNNEVKHSDILNILLPATRESINPDISSEDRTVILNQYKTNEVTFNSSFNTLQQQTDGYLASIATKINLTKDNISELDINIEGVVKVEDPDVLNDNIISNEVYTPSIYIVDPIQGGIDNKQRIFTSFEGPWITTTKSLSTNKNIVVGDLKFEDGITIDKLNIASVTSANLEFKYTHKIPMYIEDSEGIVSTYFLLASAVS
jgi:hypothetical protein